MFHKVTPVLILIFLSGLVLLASCTPSTPEPPVEPLPSPDAQQPAEDSASPSPDVQQPDEDSASRSPSERVPRITAEELFQKMEHEENILIVDTRADVETSFEEDHITGAVPVPLSQILDKQWVPSSDIEIILYCT
jgi:hypothetical protein